MHSTTPSRRHFQPRVVAALCALSALACLPLLAQSTLPATGQVTGLVSGDGLGGQLHGLDSGFVTVGGNEVLWLHRDGGFFVSDTIVTAADPQVAGAGELVAVWDGDVLRAYEMQSGSMVAAGTGSLAALPEADRRLIATDGTRIAVAVATDGTTYEGHVFVRIGDTWIAQTALGADADLDLSYARAMEIEAGRALVGTGSEIFWYVVPGPVTPSPPQLLEAPFLSSAFGTAISADGDRLAVGAPLTAFGFINPIGGAGRVYLYDFDSGSNAWILDVSVSSPTPASGARFGSGLVLTGAHLAVGEPFTGAAAETGNAYVFREDSGWQYLYDLQQSIPDNDQRFGAAVASSRSVAVGAPETDAVAQFGNGAVFFFDALSIFTDGFESGNISSWSASVP